MNSHQPTVTPVAAPAAAPAPATRWLRPRTIAAIVAGVIVVGILGSLAAWYFLSCTNCRGGPILCDDPCSLPTFGEMRDSGFGTSDFALNALAPAPRPRRAS
jgi:hypothetical protein